jgi:DnaJ-class molecular chaperone
MTTRDEDTLHEHEPTETIAALYHTCKHCGEMIEAENCEECDGTGGTLAGPLGRQLCFACKGTGRKRWILLTP